MPLWRCPWPGLALLPLLCGCVLRGGQPEPPHIPPPQASVLAHETLGGLAGDLGMLIGACLGCLPALAWLLLGGQRRRGRLARPGYSGGGAALLIRLRFLQREVHRLMVQGRPSARVLELGSRRRDGRQSPSTRGHDGL